MRSTKKSDNLHSPKLGRGYNETAADGSPASGGALLHLIVVDRRAKILCHKLVETMRFREE
jgi:hypothetical protein